MYTNDMLYCKSSNYNVDGHLLEAVVFDDSWKNFRIIKFSSDDHHIDIRNGSIY